MFYVGLYEPCQQQLVNRACTRRTSHTFNRRSLSGAGRVLRMCIFSKSGEGGSFLKFGKILRYTFNVHFKFKLLPVCMTFGKPKVEKKSVKALTATLAVILHIEIVPVYLIAVYMIISKNWLVDYRLYS